MGGKTAEHEMSGALTSLKSAVFTLAHGRQRFATGDLRIAQAHLRALHSSIRLTLPVSSQFISYRAASAPLGDLLLTVGRIEARNGYELHYASGDEFLISVAFQGAGWVASGATAIELRPAEMLVVAPSCAVSKQWDGPGAVLTLHIPLSALESAARHHVRTTLDAFAPMSCVKLESLPSFVRLLTLTCTEAANPSPSPLLAEGAINPLENLMLALLSAELPANLHEPRRSISPAAPYYVRRAENFMRAQAHRELVLQDLAEAAGVSIRSLQYGFRRYRDTTPMLFLKRVRYERARTLLVAAGGRKPRIRDVAAHVGCSNASQFARDYREIFGESPSQTSAGSRVLVS